MDGVTDDESDDRDARGRRGREYGRPRRPMPSRGGSSPPPGYPSAWSQDAPSANPYWDEPVRSPDPDPYRAAASGYPAPSRPEVEPDGWGESSGWSEPTGPRPAPEPGTYRSTRAGRPEPQPGPRPGRQPGPRPDPGIGRQPAAETSHQSDYDVQSGRGAGGYPGRSEPQTYPGQRSDASDQSGAVARAGAAEPRTRTGATGSTAPRERVFGRRRHMPLWQELPLLIIIAFCLAVLIRTFLLQAFFIPSGSMENTLAVGDRVLVNKVVYDVRAPKRGEVVVFRGTDRWAPEHVAPPPSSVVGRVARNLGDLVGISQPGQKDFIKRVVGLPGDIVACCDVKGRVTVNGYPLAETYIFENSPVDVPPDAHECRSRRFDPVTVPEGQIFVMGDHRLVSQDARCQGPVPIDNIIGRAFLVLWPAGHWSTLPAPDTFAGVPKPIAFGDPSVDRPDRRPSGGGLVAVAWLLPYPMIRPAFRRAVRRRRRARRAG